MVAPIDRSAGPWIALLKFLTGGIHDLQSTWPGRNPPFPQYQERLAFFRSEELPHIPQIERAIDHWLDMGQWPLLSFEVKYHLHLRFSAASILLSRMVIGLDRDEPVTIFPFPSLDRPIVARWLLTDWWQGCGQELLCSLGDPHQSIGE